MIDYEDYREGIRDLLREIYGAEMDDKDEE